MTYGKIVCDVRPQNVETNRTRLTFGGSSCNTEINCGTPTANLLFVKLWFNSVILTPGAKFLRLDVKDFYLNMPMDRPEFLRIKIENFPDDFVEQYKLKDVVDTKKIVMIRVKKVCTAYRTQELLRRSS